MVNGSDEITSLLYCLQHEKKRSKFAHCRTGYYDKKPVGLENF